MNVLAIRPVATPLTPEPTAPMLDIWLSAADIADARLPGLPKNKRKVNELAKRLGWAFKIAPDGTEMARARSGRGGGVEYHVDLLPPAARAKIVERRAPASSTVPADNDSRSSIWQWFDQQKDTTKTEAAMRLAVIQAVEACVCAGQTRSSAVVIAAAHYGRSGATVWNWIAQIEGVSPHDWLPHLAPRRIGGGKACDVEASVWNILISDYLRAEQPTWESCYYRAKRLAESQGITLPSSRTLRRKMETEVNELVRIKRREGREAHARTMPPQIRTVSAESALSKVNIDGHKWDVFVNWPGRDKPIRPIMVAIQDIYSRKILSWRLDESENTAVTRMVFADLFRDYGIPKVCILDNGRAFASKAMTGGAKTRYRFKIKPDDPIGLLPMLGVTPQFATPYHGQAKPIERAFRDLSDAVAKHPAFAGAYTGRHSQAQPENYQSNAIDLDVFTGILRAEIAAHNAKEGRRTEMAKGRSFDAVFAESYAVNPIRKATAEQLRMALLTAADNVRTHRHDGSIGVAGNRYWTGELSMIAGTAVMVRFDPDNLHSEIHVYTRDGKFIATAPIWNAAGFANMAEAKKLQKIRKDWRRKTKDAEQAMDLLDAEELAASMPKFVEPDLPSSPIVRPVRSRGQTAAALKADLEPHLMAVQPPLNAPKKASAMDRFTAAHTRLKLVK